MFKQILLSFIFGMLTGIIIMLKIHKPKLDTDICTDYLSERGYSVHMRKNEKR